MTPKEKEALVELLQAHADRIITKLGGDNVHCMMHLQQAASRRVERAEREFLAEPEESAT